ncbi:MAG: adenylate/guanylate cyclase domain-containing protein [Chlorobi bacterium]|nr:adenylate/guanylate cyclase domain-containing protein [Chlorobiota bacterium]
MKQKYKIYLYDWLFLIFAWMVYMSLVYIIVWSFKEYINFGIFTDYTNSMFVHFEAPAFGFIFGSFFTVIHHLTELPRIRRMSFSRIILLKSFLYLAGLGLASVILWELWRLLGAMDETTLKEAKRIITLKALIISLIYLSFYILLTNFLLEINKKFGYGTLWQIVTGKYHRPKVENRVFMFLDLKSSTTIAEKLGHKLYSQLIQSCFYDLTDIVIKYQAHVYQYVGDEVVLTWTNEKGLKDLNCIRFFFAYKDKLFSRKNYYESKFNLIPEFKAGLEMGSVTVVEVGEIKREIAYHGDVLNTAARIQDRCNEFGRLILISENIEKAIESIYQIKVELMGDIQLKGKGENIKIYSVENELK